MGQREHGSPADRGSADAYYGRGPRPHWYIGGIEIEAAGMSQAQRDAYMDAYENETDRKDYGNFDAVEEYSTVEE